MCTQELYQICVPKSTFRGKPKICFINPLDKNEYWCALNYTGSSIPGQS